MSSMLLKRSSPHGATRASQAAALAVGSYSVDVGTRITPATSGADKSPLVGGPSPVSSPPRPSLSLPQVCIATTTVAAGIPSATIAIITVAVDCTIPGRVFHV